MDKKSVILLVVVSAGSAETKVGCGGKLNSHLMASCVRNIYTKNDQNLIIGFQVTVKNVRDVFLETQCKTYIRTCFMQIEQLDKVSQTASKYFELTKIVELNFLVGN